MTRPDRPVQFALFDAVADAASEHRGRLDLEPGAVVLRAFAVEEAPALLPAIDQIAQGFSVAPHDHGSWLGVSRPNRLCVPGHRVA